MTPANNLVYFPKVPVREIPQSLDEIMKRVSDNRKTHADIIAQQIFSEILRVGEQEGLVIEISDNAKDLVLAFEAIKSMFYKAIGHEHSLQKFALKNIELIENLPEDIGPYEGD